MIPVRPTTALPPGEATRVEAEPIAVFYADGDFHAIDDPCTHQAMLRQLFDEVATSPTHRAARREALWLRSHKPLVP